MADELGGVSEAELSQLQARVAKAGLEVRRLKSAKEDFADALKELLAAKEDFKQKTGKDYVAPGSKSKSSKSAKKAAKVARAEEKKRQAAEAAKNAYQPRYEPPDNSKLPEDTRGAPVEASNFVRVGEKYYVSTAINYTNGKPHIGHAYEAVTADVISRYHRVYGRDVFFLTGSDEHGKKVQKSAEAAGVKPIEIADKYSLGFQALNRSLNISNDRYIRTTEPEHCLTAQMMFQRADDAGDIYLKNYEGWYDVHAERFVADAEAEQMGYKDEHNRPFERHNEASYHFRMSKYQQRLVDHIKANPEFIQPESQRNMILSRLKEPLQDLSASRPTSSLKWGIPLPKDPSHVMYVWFDALTNYISGVNYRHPHNALRNIFWPCDVHIVGRDIMWFHCVIWPCMLLSAGVPLPKTIFGHGWVLAGDMQKMSKSIGNVVDPVKILERFPADSFRLYLVEEATYGDNMGFQLENMITRHNTELADTLGNLVHRVCHLITSIHGGGIPDYDHDPDVPFDLQALNTAVEQHMKVFRLREAVQTVMDATRHLNNWLYKKEPWKIKGEDRAQRCGPILRTAVEAIYVLAHHFAPYIPDAVADIEVKLHTQIGTIAGLRDTWDNLKPGAPVDKRGILFAKIALEPPKGQKQAQPKGGGKKANNGQGADTFARLDIRVGQVMKVWPHPTREQLYCEEIDVGEGTPRTIASALRQYIPLEEFQGKKVVVFCNLKDAVFDGFTSQGMLLAGKTKNKKHCELLEPPEDAVPGDRVVAPDVEMLEPAPPGDIDLKKLRKVLAKMRTGKEDTTGYYKNKPLTTKAGVCKCATLLNTKLS